MPQSNDIRKAVTDRVLQIREMAIDRGLVLNKTDWGEKVGIDINAMPAIYRYDRFFTLEQIYAAVELIDGDYNFVFGKSPKVISNSFDLSPIDRIRQAVIELENTGKPHGVRKIKTTKRITKSITKVRKKAAKPATQKTKPATGAGSKK